MEQQRTALMHSHPEQIVARAEEIYARKFKKEFENKHRGKFAVIDITTEKAYLGDFSGDALQSALKDSPHGIFHLIRIGSRAAHKMRGYGH
ncbi:MAG: hypothetical protein ACHQNE_05795 [Candidatus Kapaibacterium sp.]